MDLLPKTKPTFIEIWQPTAGLVQFEQKNAFTKLNIHFQSVSLYLYHAKPIKQPDEDELKLPHFRDK